MFAARTLQRQCLRTISSSYLLNNPHKKLALARHVMSNVKSSNVVVQSTFQAKYIFFTYTKHWNCFDGSRGISTARSRDKKPQTASKGMRHKVERRLQKETGKTLKEIRRAKKLHKKLMTDEERLIYNLRRAKKKVALLLQRLKKYELPELPPPRHDPELLTAEQLQAYKKIGFKNKNYVPVGIRGVFGGVVQNMHLHWKFHETVQVCCDNFPKEKIKEMASMLARLSGGIVINIHNTKTIIMFRGRNYRQPKNLIPINTLTKRKALFKARFEQALESQKLNIKKIEQQLRRTGVNPDDPVAMASIHRVASTFFNAIDEKDGSPYVFPGDKQAEEESDRSNIQQLDTAEDSDQEELDKFIAEIERAADKEWAEEEAAEKEEVNRLKYWNKEDFGGRFRRSEMVENEDSDGEIKRSARNGKDAYGRKRIDDSEVEDDDDDDDEDYDYDSDDVGGMSKHQTDARVSTTAYEKNRHKVERWTQDKIGSTYKKNSFKKDAESNRTAEADSGSDDMLSDLENVMWESENTEDEDSRRSGGVKYKYVSSNEEEDYHQKQGDEENGNARPKMLDNNSEGQRMRNSKEVDEYWESD